MKVTFACKPAQVGCWHITSIPRLSDAPATIHITPTFRAKLNHATLCLGFCAVMNGLSDTDDVAQRQLWPNAANPECPLNGRDRREADMTAMIQRV